jgi:hypothetical protein
MWGSFSNGGFFSKFQEPGETQSEHIRAFQFRRPWKTLEMLITAGLGTKFVPAATGWALWARRQELSSDPADTIRATKLLANLLDF